MPSIYRKQKGLSESERESVVAPIAAFDFETAGLGGALLGASYCLLDAGGAVIDSAFFGVGDALIANEEDIARRIINIILSNPGHIWYAHNASYDWRYILPPAVAAGIALEFLLGGQDKLIQVKLGDSLTRDSYSLFPTTLKKFASTYVPELPKLEIEDITKFDPTNARHRDYALRDSVSLALAVHRHREFISDKFDSPISVSAAGTSMRAFKNHIDEREPIIADDKLDEFFRACYVGGFVAPLIVSPQSDAVTYDINSSYPYTMRKDGFPFGKPYALKEEHKKMIGRKPHYWRAKVFCPESVPVPVLPRRDKYGLTWPRGHFEVYATGDELVFAESVGYEVDYLDGYGFVGIQRAPFESFIDLCESLRMKHKGEAVEAVIKLMQNSLYGKFGTRKERSAVIPDSEVDAENVLRASPLDLLPGYSIIKSYDEEVIAAPHIAAWITAHARLNLFRAIYAGGAREVIYCDTDSITVTPNFDASKISIGNAYGQYKKEKEWARFRAAAPKVYAGQFADGTWHGACKGIPNPSQEDYAALYSGEQISAEYLSLPGAAVYLAKGGDRNARMARRTSTSPANVRGWKIEGEKCSPIFLEKS